MRNYACLTIAIFLFCLIASTACVAHVHKSELTEQVSGGEIDWGNEMLYAVGEGVIPSSSEEPSYAKAYMKAKGYAKMQAIANLLMVIEGTRISYDAYGKDYMAVDEILRQRIEGYVRGVRVLDTKKVNLEGETIVQVTVGTQMYGPGSPGSLFLEKAMKTADADPLPQTEIETANKSVDRPDIPSLADQKGPFTSVIIDSRGFNVVRAMSPKIRRADGSEVWGTIKVSPEYAIETGIVSYTRTLEDAMKSVRCGDNPLLLGAIGRAGGNAMCDVVISDEDAKALIAADAETKFLEKCRVILVVDPPRR